MNRNQPVKTLVDKIWNDQSYCDSIKQNLAFIDILQENRLALFMIGNATFGKDQRWCTIHCDQ